MAEARPAAQVVMVLAACASTGGTKTIAVRQYAVVLHANIDGNTTRLFVCL